jgi:transcriptional regulator with XRE-family HTH domain
MIHDNIRYIRTLGTISQEEIAEHLGMSQSSYGKLERGSSNMSVKRLEQLATFFGMDMFDIVNFDPHKLFGAAPKVVEQESLPLSPTDDSNLSLLKARVMHLEETGALMREQLQDKDEIIALLRK